MRLEIEELKLSQNNMYSRRITRLESNTDKAVGKGLNRNGEGSKSKL